MSTVRLLHLELGYSHPYQDNHSVSSLLKAVKRVKGHTPAYKLTLSLAQIHSMGSHLDFSCLRDLQIWCVINLCLFGLLRISSITVKNKHVNVNKTLTRKDISFTPQGCVLSFRHSKTIQFQERVFECVIPHLEGDPHHCPASLLLTFLSRAGNVPDSAPALSYFNPAKQLVTITTSQARDRFKHLLQAIGLSTRDHNTHSLRRSGASYLISAGVDLSVIKVLGDWRSDAVFKYLKPQTEDRLKLAKQGFSSLAHKI